MKFKLILEQLLLEATADEIYEKYYSDIKKSLFDRIASLDPGTTRERRPDTINPSINKLGKYVKILIDLYRKDELKQEDYPKAQKYLSLVYQYKLPVSNIKSLGDLYNLVKDKIVNETASVEEVLPLLSPDEYKIILNGKDWYVIIPYTQKSASYLGSPEWCTTWGEFCPNKDYKDRSNHFKSHHDRGSLYIMINKNDENDRYQLHYESGQLKDKADNEVRPRESFFETRPELGELMFPAAFGKTDEINEINKELEKSSFLTGEKIKTLINKQAEYYGYEANNSPLITALHNNDKDLLNKVFNYGENEIQYDVDYVNEHSIGFSIETHKLPDELDTIDEYVRQVSFSKQGAWEWVREGFYHSDIKDDLLPYLEDYYEKNKQTLIKSYGKIANTFDNFEDFFGEQFYEDEKIWDKYVDESTANTSTNLENAYDDVIREVEDIIEINKNWSSFAIKINKTKLIEFIMKENILVISNFEEFIAKFVDYYDLPTSSEFYDIPEYDYNYASYDSMEDVINNHFEKVIENMDQMHDADSLGDSGIKCAEIRGEFTKILNKEFDDDGVFENEHIKLIIQKPWSSHFTCKNGGQVEIEYFNKDKNTKFEGWIRVENIYKYLTNFQLFEAHNKFKRLIKD